MTRRAEARLFEWRGVSRREEARVERRVSSTRVERREEASFFEWRGVSRREEARLFEWRGVSRRRQVF